MENFHAIVQHTPLMLWTAKPNGELDFVNEGVLSYTQQNFDDMLKWGWAKWIHPDDLPDVGEHWSRALETGEPYGLTFRIRRARDGSYRRHVAQALPQRDAGGTIVKWYGYCADIESQGAWDASALGG